MHFLIIAQARPEYVGDVEMGATSNRNLLNSVGLSSTRPSALWLEDSVREKVLGSHTTGELCGHVSAFRGSGISCL